MVRIFTKMNPFFGTVVSCVGLLAWFTGNLVVNNYPLDETLLQVMSLVLIYAGGGAFVFRNTLHFNWMHVIATAVIALEYYRLLSIGVANGWYVTLFADMALMSLLLLPVFFLTEIENDDKETENPERWTDVLHLLVVG